MSTATRLEPRTITAYQWPAEAARTRWEPCSLAEIPSAVRFDVLRRDAGQIVEISYGTLGRAEAGTGDPWKCVHDRSETSGPVYYRRVARALARGRAGQ